jgi:hypothetical protein
MDWMLTSMFRRFALGKDGGRNVKPDAIIFDTKYRGTFSGLYPVRRRFVLAKSHFVSQTVRRRPFNPDVGNPNHPEIKCDADNM